MLPFWKSRNDRVVNLRRNRTRLSMETLEDRTTPTTVTLTAADNLADENGAFPANQGRWEITRDTTGAPLTIVLSQTLGGGATSADFSYAVQGGSYDVANNLFTFNASIGTAKIILSAINDTAQESAETVQLSIGANPSYTVGSPSSGTITIPANDTPTVTLTATDATADENGAYPANQGTWRITRSSSAGTLAVKLTPTLTGISAADYSLSVQGGTFNAVTNVFTFNSSIAAGKIVFTAVNDFTKESTESLGLAIATNSAYAIGAPSSGTITIPANDTPTVTLTATDATADENGAFPNNQGTWTITRSSSAGTLAVKLTPTLIGISAADYKLSVQGGTFNATTNVFTFNASIATSKIVFTAVNDTATEAAESLRLVLAANAAYAIGTSSAGTITIPANDKPTVTLAATDATADENGAFPNNQGTWTITRSTTGSSLAVQLAKVFVGLSSADYTLSTQGGTFNFTTGVFTFNPTIATGKIVLTAVNDTLAEPVETFKLTIKPNVAYTIGAISTGTIKINENDGLSALNGTYQGTYEGSVQAGGDSIKLTPNTLRFTILNGVVTFTQPTTATGSVTVTGNLTTGQINLPDSLFAGLITNARITFSGAKTATGFGGSWQLTGNTIAGPGSGSGTWTSARI